MKCFSLILLLLVNTYGLANTVTENVYIESPTDTDGDGKLDRIYAEITRAKGPIKLPSIFKISPYALGGNPVVNHNVDVDFLPQDDFNMFSSFLISAAKPRFTLKTTSSLEISAVPRGYASVSAHSLGTGKSTGCPTVGDSAETSATKAVIDWLNGRAKGYSKSGAIVKADWSNGNVGMYGVSYNGTLPNMVATTGVEGLKAIVPIAAISNWYDYYRANGLVVGPGGYIGEDADSLAKYVVRKNTCREQISKIGLSMGRDHGDNSNFWQEREYVSKADQVKAAVFIVHGQADWNVRQRHAIQWWEALQGRVPLRMWLHRSGHSHAPRADAQSAIWQWFDFYVKGIDNGVDEKPKVEVQYLNGEWRSQQQWPYENTDVKTFYLNPTGNLSSEAEPKGKAKFVDRGKRRNIRSLISNPDQKRDDRLVFVSERLDQEQVLSGTPSVSLKIAVMNRRAANISVVVVDYDRNNRERIITRGWVDPQNHQSFDQGELLVKGEMNVVEFQLEPKQYKLRKDHRLGVVVTATDYDHTLRPSTGTEFEVLLGAESSITLNIED